MPKTRPADYYLEFNNFSVCIDFKEDMNGLIYLVRISFDGYGCCEVNNPNTTLDTYESSRFVDQLKSNNLDQETIKNLVDKLISTNGSTIRKDALKAYDLCE